MKGGSEKMKKEMMLGMIIVVCAMQIGMILAQNNENNSNLSIDPKIYDKLNNSEWVEVIIGVVSENVREDTIASLSESKVRTIERWQSSGKKFSIEVTREGLDELIENPNVEWIDLGGGISPADDIVNNITQNEDPDLTNDVKDWKDYDQLLWLVGIVIILIITILILKTKKK